MNPWLNYVKGTLGSGMDAVTTSLTLSVGQGANFPDPADGHYWITVWDKATNPDPSDAAGDVENMRVTNLSGDVLTVVRGEDGETAVTHSSGHAVELMADRRNFENHAWANVRSFGAHPDNAAASNVTAIQAAIDSVEAVGGGTLYVPSIRNATYNIDAEFTVTGPMHIVFEKGASFTQATTGVAAFRVTSSNVHIRDAHLIGPGASPRNDDGSAIIFEGASTGSRLVNVSATGCFLDTWSGMGVRARFCDNVHVDHNTSITNCGAAGVMFFSVTDFSVDNNYIHDLPGAAGDAYGVAVTRDATDTTTVFPRSRNGTIKNNVVVNVQNWEGLDTHSGENIEISGNVIRNTLMGIAIADSTDGGSTNYEARNITICNNVIDSTVTDGSRRHGIVAHGSHSSLGDTSTLLSVSITGNTVIGHGESNGTQDGAIYIYNTQGAVVSGNSILEPGGEGVRIEFNNFCFSVTGNSIVDAFEDNAGNAMGIRVRDDFNEGYIGGNSIRTLNKTATAVQDYGIFVSNTAGDTNNAIVIGPNHIEGSGTADVLFGLLNDTFVKVGTTLKTQAGRVIDYQNQDASSYNLTSFDHYIAQKTDTITPTITLPATHEAGRQYWIRDRNSNAVTNNITVARNGNLINGAASDYVINVSGQTVIFTSNGSGWFTSVMTE